MFNNYPWTNDHQLNLDWILRSLNKLKGGKAGEMLIKASDADWDFTWVFSGQYEVVNTNSDLAMTTQDHVLVLHNNSDIGDSGPCWFEIGPWTDDGYLRDNGSRVFPMLDQSALIASTAPIDSIWGVITSYVENPSLVYGQSGTMYDDTVTNKIDCSTFVSAVLDGVPYNCSRYVNGSSGYNRRTVKISDFGPNRFVPIGYSPTHRMAQYFAERKWLHKMPIKNNIGNVLQFGDILFMTTKTSSMMNRFMQIGHCAMVLAVFPGDASLPAKIVIAEGGQSPARLIDQMNDPTNVCKISTLSVTDDLINTYMPAFARIPFVEEAISDPPQILSDGYNIKKVLIPNCQISGTHNGIMVPSTHYAASGFVAVEPGNTITYTGALTGTKDGNTENIFIHVAEYNKNFEFLNYTSIRLSPLTVSVDTAFIRFDFGWENNFPVLISDIDKFSVKLTLTLPVPVKNGDYKGVLPSGDLNTVSTPGVYRLSGANSYTNAPSTFGMLECITAEEGQILLQRVTTVSNMFIRYANIPNTDPITWNGWFKFTGTAI